ncbi:helix-turn-helix transcriptional regulator [Roseinatronobacter sp.]|uniref:helix-turn-helix transcriptional regulator n=1 Tax=Roseinatronobacter sp. TaxID=1945755 RepID=UPI0025FDCA10|nr:WYL domain-containing protein [Roseibaca sp.]
MSFQKAKDLLKLADLAASRHRGITVKEIAAEFSVNDRTAQRMLVALKELYPSLQHRTDSERRRWWTLREANKLGMQGIFEHELASLEMAIRRAEREDAHSEVASLQAVRDRLVAKLPEQQALRTTADAEAMLELNGYACRPGPWVKTCPDLMKIVTVALKGQYQLIIAYQGKHDAEPRKRIIEPYGVLLGTRHYLVARDPEKDGGLRRFRLDRITHAQLTQDWFRKDVDFDLEAYAAQSFGSFHADAEFNRVVWRFTPAAAATAREFVFHPRQEMAEQEDGGLIVTFEASGLVEMAWHLYKWGGSVEVIEPAALRDLVAGRQNDGISVLP